MTYKSKFVNCTIFMQDSLSDLVDNLGEHINKSKNEDSVDNCKECKRRQKEKCKKIYCK